MINLKSNTRIWQSESGKTRREGFPLPVLKKSASPRGRTWREASGELAAAHRPSLALPASGGFPLGVGKSRLRSTNTCWSAGKTNTLAGPDLAACGKNLCQDKMMQF